MLTAPLIRRFAPAATPEIVAGLVAGWPQIYAAGIVTPRRLQHFMAEIATETGGLARLEENLNYSAPRLVAVWPKRFPSIAAAAPYAHAPEHLADKIYGGRLGNSQPSDGWTFRGGGLLQDTGRANYRAAGYEASPDALRSFPGALTAALTFWTDNKLNLIAERGDDPLLMRRAINLGDPWSNATPNGLADARAWQARARSTFTTIMNPAALALAQAARRAA